VRVLVVNAGSSSLKLRLLGDGDELLAERDLSVGEPIGELGALGEADAVGHRVVHGGTRFSRAVRVDGEVAAALRELVALAPLHQPAALDAIDAVADALPGVPAVACFDTAFHATLTPAAATYPLPRAWRERHPLRRFGFHGLSHAYASRRAVGMLGRTDRDLRVVTCHLGAGASLAAVRGGRCLDTTMGFTPLEGLCMATRSGSVDPGLLLWLQRQGGMSAEELEHGLERESGLRGLAGDGDMRAVLAAAAAGSLDARLALDVYVHRLRAAIAAMTAALGGLDALVFTGGVGERSADIRAAAAAGLGFLGVAVDEDPRAPVAPDAEITAVGATARTLVVAAREDLEIARQVRALSADDGPTNAEAS
jgi:acetate kinase